MLTDIPRREESRDPSPGRLELADILRAHGHQLPSLSAAQAEVMNDLVRCRTAELGGHILKCPQCGHEKPSYNSCRNRHCPKCQSLQKARWLEARMADLLPVHYFHVVFTVPEGLNPLILRNQRTLCNILFRAVSETLREVAANPAHLGAQIGFIAVLHTWGQTLVDHPHLHCVVPGGGLSPDGSRWIPCPKDFFLPVRVLSEVFRGKFLQYTERAFRKGQLDFPGQIESLADPVAFKRLLQSSTRSKWVVYAKRPFAGPEQVLEYLGRYTHGVALSNNRLVAMQNGQVTFTWKDYRQGGMRKTMTLAATEFIRRFLLHILPKHFVRIRHYGMLGNPVHREKLAQCRRHLGVCAEAQSQTVERLKDTWQELLQRLTGVDATLCPHCKIGHLVVCTTLQRTDVPRHFRARRGAAP